MPGSARLVRATVFVNGRRVRVVSGRRLRAPVIEQPPMQRYSP